jgi:hypothetical protein
MAFSSIAALPLSANLIPKEDASNISPDSAWCDPTALLLYDVYTWRECFLHISNEKGSNFMQWKLDAYIKSAVGEYMTPGDCVVYIDLLSCVDELYTAATGIAKSNSSPTLYLSNIQKDTIAVPFYSSSSMFTATFDAEYYLLNTTANSYYQDNYIFGRWWWAYYNASYGSVTTYNNKMECDMSWALHPSLVVNSTYYNLGNTRIQVFDKVSESWIEQDPTDLTLSHPQYKMRLYDSETNNLIYEDQTFVNYSTYRTVTLPALKIVNNAAEPINASITQELNSTGNYKGVYTFRNNTIDEMPADWTSAGTAGTVTVVESIYNHNYCLKLTDNMLFGYQQAIKDVNPQSNGTVEFYIAEESNKTIYTTLRNSSSSIIAGVGFKQTAGLLYLSIFNVSAWITLSFINPLVFQRIKISFNLTTYWVWLNNTFVDSFPVSSIGAVSKIFTETDYTANGVVAYWDSISPIWQEETWDYFEGDLLYEETYSIIIANKLINPYSSLISNFTQTGSFSVFYYDLYSNLLENTTFEYPSQDILDFIPPNCPQSFISLHDQGARYLDWENYIIKINGTQIYSNIFFQEVDTCWNVSIYNHFGKYLTSTLHTIEGGLNPDNYIPITLTIYSLKIYNQQSAFLHYNLTTNPSDGHYWSEWLAPGEVGEQKLYSNTYTVELMHNESGTPSYATYTYTLNTDDVLLISSSNTIFNVIQNINTMNSSINSQFTYVALNFTNTNTAIGNQTVLLNINFNNVNSSLENMLLSSQYSFNFLNSSINTLLQDTSNTFTFINSSLNSVMQNLTNSFNYMNSTLGNIFVLSQNSFDFANTSLASLLVDTSNSFSFTNSSLNYLRTLTQDSFTFLNSSVTSIVQISQNSFLFLNSSVADLLAYSSNGFNFTNTSIQTLLAESVNSFLYINSTVGQTFILSNSSFSYINATLGSIVSLTDNSFVFINSSLTDLLIDTSNTFSFMNTTLVDLVLSTGNSFSFVNSTISTLLINQQNSFEFVNSTLTNLYAVTDNSFTFINGSVGTLISMGSDSFVFLNSTVLSLLAQSQNSFSAINSTLNSVETIALNSFLYLNSSIQDSITYLSQNFTYTNSLINQNQINLLTNFAIINSNITNNSIAIQTKIETVNSTISALIASLQNNVLLMNNSIYTAILNVSTNLLLDSNSIMGNLTLVYEQNEFLTELFKATMFSDLLNWTGVGTNYSLIENQIADYTFVNNLTNQAITYLLKYQNKIETLTLAASESIPTTLPNANVQYRIKSVESGEYLTEWTNITSTDNNTISWGYDETDYSGDEVTVTAVTPVDVFLVIVILGACAGVFYLSLKKYPIRKKYPTSENRAKSRVYSNDPIANIRGR